MTVRDRYEGLQSTLLVCGDGGCHFLSLCSIIEDVNKQPLDLIDAIRTSMSKGWFSTDFTGKDAIAFLEHYTNKKWSRKEVDILPIINYNDYTEAVYFNPRTKIHHYRRRGYDTLNHSITVEEGYVEKYYVYTWADK